MQSDRDKIRKGISGRMRRTVMVLQDTLKECLHEMTMVFLFMAGSALVFYLYALPLEPFFYVFLLWLVGETAFFSLCYLKNMQKAKTTK